ncbi:MAG TPA: rhomboid family intramembrane serine protease [Candidatus Angelobacter sp.]|nr:rhomboid family intramembrane serine protease [Candidatus Angelobacter sp.]
MTAASRSSPATYVLLAVNIVVFIVMVASGVSFIDPKAGEVLRWGANYGPKTLSGQYWRLITSMFLHFGIIHLAGNMWCLWNLGQLAEKLVGSVTLLGLYLLTGIAASLSSLSWDPMRVSAGASGAIFGIAGALIAVLQFGNLGLPVEAVRKLRGYVLRFALLNLLFGLQGHIDNMAHAGGLVSGLLMGFFIARTFNASPEASAAKRRRIMAVSAAIIIGLTVAVSRAKQFAVDLGEGVAALQQDNPTSAIPHLQKYLATRPADAYGHALLGSALQQANRLDEAEQEFERALAIAPDYPSVEVNLAKLYAYQKNTAKALVLFKKGISHREPDGDTDYYYALALKDAGDLGEAESVVRRAIQLRPKNLDAHELLAEILQMEGKKNEAAAEEKEMEK